MFSKCKFTSIFSPFPPFILGLTTSNQSTAELQCKLLRITGAVDLLSLLIMSCYRALHWKGWCLKDQCIQSSRWARFTKVLHFLYSAVLYIGNYSALFNYALTKKYSWVSAGNISQTAYVLSVIYFPFTFLYRTSSLCVCQIMCQILEVTEREKNRQKQ